MNISQTEENLESASQEDKKDVRFGILLPPIVLILIAVNQMFLAHTKDLSPWKGGGFGMFGAIDSPGMRVFSYEAVDKDGQECRVSYNFPKELGGSRYLRTFPDQKLLQMNAEHMLESQYVFAYANHLKRMMKLKEENPHLDIEAKTSFDESRITYRMVREDEVIEEDKIVTLKSVKMQMWRLRYDKNTDQVFCEPIGDAVEAQKEDDEPTTVEEESS